MSDTRLLQAFEAYRKPEPQSTQSLRRELSYSFALHLTQIPCNDEFTTND